MSDYETSQKIRNLAVGIFVIIGLVALGWLIFKFGDLPALVTKLKSFDIYVQFASAPGAQANTPVQFCGYQIGRITAVQPPQLRDELLNGQNTGRRFHQILVTISIDKKYTNIPADSKIKLMARSYGSSFIQIIPPSNTSAVRQGQAHLEMPDPNFRKEWPSPETKFLVAGMLLQGSTSAANDIIPEETMLKLNKFVTDLNILINNTNDIIGDPNNKKNIADTLSNFNKTAEQASQSLKQLESFLAAGTATSEELNRTVVQLTAILEKVDTGVGSASKFVNDPKFYESLLESSKQLQLLLEEARQLIEKLKKEGVKFKL